MKDLNARTDSAGSDDRGQKAENLADYVAKESDTQHPSPSMNESSKGAVSGDQSDCSSVCPDAVESPTRRRVKRRPGELLLEYERLRELYARARSDLATLRTRAGTKFPWEEVKKRYLERYYPELTHTRYIEEKGTYPSILAHSHLAVKYKLGGSYIYQAVALERSRGYPTRPPRR